MPLTTSAREFVPPVPSTLTKATTTNTTKDNDEKKNSSQNSNLNANEKKTLNFATRNDDDLKLPFDLNPHDAFKTDFQIGQKQLGVTPIVHAKKFSKAIAIKSAFSGSQREEEGNEGKGGHIKGNDGRRATTNNLLLLLYRVVVVVVIIIVSKLVRCFRKVVCGGERPDEDERESRGEASERGDEDEGRQQQQQLFFFCECQGRRAGRVADAGETTTTATFTKGEGF